MSEGQAGLAIKPQLNNQGILRLLILEESTSEAQALIDPLRDAGFAVTAVRAKSPLEFQAALKKQEWDVILSPPSIAGFKAKQALALLTHAKMDIPFIIVSNHFEDEEFSEALRCGARALIKRNQSDQLILTIQRELRDLGMRRARHHYEKMFRQAERRCHALLESSGNAITCVRNGKVIYSNPAFNILVGKGKERIITNIIGIIHPNDRERFEQLLKGIEDGEYPSDKVDLRVLDESDKPQRAKIEAMVAYVNEQLCAQVTINLDDGADATAKQTTPNPSIEIHDETQSQDTTKHTSSTDIAPNTNDDPDMQQRIRDALSNNRLRMVYQPIVPLHAQPAEKYEVLIRMIDENGEEVPPAEFMPVAEKGGLMREIDRWVICTAMQILVKRHGENKETSLFVKLSEDSLSDRTLVPWINESLSEFHLPGDTLIFEIKESYVLHQPEMAKQLIDELKQLHCGTAIGHFGSDPRSLDQLEQLRVDFVKLAGTFVDKLDNDPKSQAMIKAVVQTAHDLGTLTVATFVQDAIQMTTLWQCNVDLIQGYYLQGPDEDMSYNFSEQED